MSVITDTWRQLVRRRLWPIAVLLLGGLVAVPMLLAKSPAAPPPQPVPATADKGPAPAGGGLEEPIVAMADTASRGRRHVLGPSKDPFAPAPVPKAKKSDAPTTQSASPQGTDLGTGSGSAPVGGGSSPIAPVTPVGGGSPYTPPSSPLTPGVPSTPTTPSAPKPKPPAPGTLTVRFGDATGGSLATMKVKKLDALPDPDQPVVIYLGPGRSAHTAQFLIDSSVTPEGDGVCLPSPADCQKLELHQGETEFLTVTVADGDASTAGSATQYELDLVKVVGKPKAKSTRAHRAQARHARAARVGVTIARVVKLLNP